MKRTEAREYLMQLIFEMQAQRDTSEGIIQRFADEAIGDDPQREYFDSTCRSYVENREAVDGLIEQSSDGWRLSRLAKVDLAILRLAVTEIKFSADNGVPQAVAIDEAVNMAKKYGDEKSGKFVNGVLGKIARS